MTTSSSTWPPTTPIYDELAARLARPYQRRNFTYAAAVAAATRVTP